MDNSRRCPRPVLAMNICFLPRIAPKATRARHLCSAPVAINIEVGLMLGHDSRFQHGNFADHLDPHGGAGLDGPVIAGQMLRRLSVDRRRNNPAEQMRHVKSVQRYFVLLTGDRPRLDADMDGLCRAVFRRNRRVGLEHRGRWKSLGHGSGQWSGDNDPCGSRGNAF
jgi:hypothetical protein